MKRLTCLLLSPALRLGSSVRQESGLNPQALDPNLPTLQGALQGSVTTLFRSLALGHRRGLPVSTV